MKGKYNMKSKNLSLSFIHFFSSGMVYFEKLVIFPKFCSFKKFFIYLDERITNETPRET